MYTRQPSRIPTIDRSNIIGASARCVILPSAGVVDIAMPTRTLTVRSGCGIGADRDGVSYVNSSTSNSGVLIGSLGFSDIVAVGKPISLFALVYVSSTGIRQQLWGDYSSGGGSPSLWIQASAANAWEFEVWPGIISGGTVTTGWHTVVGNITAGGAATLYVDGAYIGTASYSGARPAGAQACFLGPGAYTLIGWSGSGSLGVICDADMTQSHALSFHKNPWQMFKDPSESRMRLIRSAYVSSGGYNLTAGQGSYSLTGQAAGLKASRMLAAAQGSYALTGQAAALRLARKLVAAQGSYALTGQAAGLALGRKLVAAQGSYTLTGQAAGLALARKLAAAQGSYSLTGQSAGTYSGRVVQAAQGSYTLSGQAAGVIAARNVSLSSGGYTLSGQDVTLTYASGAKILVADAGAYALTGGDVSLVYSPVQPAGVVGGGGRTTWNPLLDFDEEKRRILEAAQLVDEDSEVKRERAKARKLERDVKDAKDFADIRALAARAAWAIERANELRREKDDEEDAIVLLALLH